MLQKASRALAWSELLSMMLSNTSIKPAANPNWSMLHLLCMHLPSTNEWFPFFMTTCAWPKWLQSMMSDVQLKYYILYVQIAGESCKWHRVIFTVKSRSFARLTSSPVRNESMQPVHCTISWRPIKHHPDWVLYLWAKRSLQIQQSKRVKQKK